MLYKFKSKAAGDLILLEPQGQQFLTLIGKTPAPQGIIEPEHMLKAIADLQEAVQLIETEQAREVAETKAQGKTPPQFGGISLRQRCKPIIDMLQRCQKAGHPIVWGV
jgi:hypothetical protein